MPLSKQAIQEFKDIYKQDYGVEFTEAEARDAGERLVKFFELLIKIDQRNGKKVSRARGST